MLASVITHAQNYMMRPLATTSVSSAVIPNTLIFDAPGDTTGDTNFHGASAYWRWRGAPNLFETSKSNPGCAFDLLAVDEP